MIKHDKTDFVSAEHAVLNGADSGVGSGQEVRLSGIAGRNYGRNAMQQGPSFISNRQRRKEGTFCALGLAGIEPTPARSRRAGCNCGTQLGGLQDAVNCRAQLTDAMQCTTKQSTFLSTAQIREKDLENNNIIYCIIYNIIYNTMY